MVEREGMTRWIFRQVAEHMWMILFFPLVASPFAFPLTLVLPHRKRKSKDLPQFVEDNSFQMFTFTVPDLFKIFLMALYAILDAVQTPSGLHLSDDAIDKWQESLEGGIIGGWVFDFYGWNWWNRELTFLGFPDEDRSANEGGSYTFSDAYLDLIVTTMMAFAIFFIAKNFGRISGKVSSMFGKQMAKRRRKKMKGLAMENLDLTTETKKSLTSMLDEDRVTLKRIKKGIIETLEEDVIDDLEIIKRQRRLKI